MKRFLTFGAFFLIIFSSYSQNCNPDNSITEPGVYPETLDTGLIDVPYTFTIQVLAIKDTMVTYLGQNITATIDSFELTGIKGLPQSFSYQCEPNKCIFTHENVGCVQLTGSPTKSEVGEHNLVIYTTAYARWNTVKIPTEDSITDYKLVIKDTGSASIFKLEKSDLTIYPNPIVNGLITVESSMDVEPISITDLTGKLIDFSFVKYQKQSVIRITNPNSGVYILRLKAGDKIISKRIIQ